MKLIEIKDISFSYDNKKDVLKHLSFDIEEGKYISLIGHNGSGKSTIAKLLIGLLSPREGQIIAFGEPIDGKNIYNIRKRIGIVFQNPDNQFIGVTVKDDIAFGLENRLVPHEQMDDIIHEFSSKVGMEQYLNKEPSSLSGGQKQRVAIAGVLAMHPDVIIFDEATAMLDPKGKREINEIIAKMRIENPKLTLISITHDIEEAFNSDEIIVLNKGEILYKDKPSEIIKYEDELISLGLDIPFVHKLKRKLIDKGIIVNGDTLDELVEQLCK